MAETKKRTDWRQEVVFVLGFFEGLLPLIATAFDFRPFLALPIYLPVVPRVIVSAVVLLAAAVALILLDRDERRA